MNEALKPDEQVRLERLRARAQKAADIYALLQARCSLLEAKVEAARVKAHRADLAVRVAEERR